MEKLKILGKTFLLFSYMVSPMHACNVLMLMGPSCAGKSTLSKALCAQFIAQEEEWKVIDFDEVDENMPQLIELANQYLHKNIKVIIDTNTYENEMEKKFDTVLPVTKIIVTAPLQLLLERDAHRTLHLARDDEKAFRCRHFVIESFEKSHTWPRDFVIDSSAHSVAQSCDIISNFLQLSQQ